MPNVFDHDPDADLDYLLDLTDWLNGTKIDTATPIITPDQSALPAADRFELHQIGVSDKQVTYWARGGVADSRYFVTWRVTRDVGGGEDFTITFVCQNN